MFRDLYMFQQTERYRKTKSLDIHHRQHMQLELHEMLLLFQIVSVQYLLNLSENLR